MRESNSISSSEVSITMSGQDRGKGVTDLSIAEANNQIVRFAEIAPQGTGIATVLHRYDHHRDFIDIVNREECNQHKNMEEELENFAQNIIY